MKFALCTLISTFCASLAAAQGVGIVSPPDGSAVTAGSNITVEVDRPGSLSPSIEVAVVIAINSCNNMPCFPPGNALGSILFNGPFNPQFENLPPLFVQHENYTVTVPASLPTGPAQLSVFHVSLVGAGPEPLVEIKNITLIVG